MSSSNLENAIFADDRQAIQYILDDPINRSTTDGWNALQKAAYYKSTEVVDELLKRGADINLSNEDGNTPLHLALEKIYDTDADRSSSNGETIDRLLQDPNVNVNQRNSDGETPLAKALKTREGPKIALKLIQHGAQVTNIDSYGHTALQLLALQIVNSSELASLLEAIVSHKDIEINQANAKGETALHMACKVAWFSHNVANVKELLKHGVDPKAQNKKGDTPLHIVCRQQCSHPAHDAFYRQLVDVFLKCPSVDINIKNRAGQTPLVVSLKEGHDTISQKLIQYGASVTQLGHSRRSALHILVSNMTDYNDQKTLLDDILQHKDIDINQEDSEGTTPLNDACLACEESCLMELVQHLIDKGARTDKQDVYGEAPLHSLCRRDELSLSTEDSSRLVETLLKDNHSILNCSNDLGLTPLHLTLFKGHFQLSLKLMEYQDIDIFKKTKNDQYTPLHMACSALRKKDHEDRLLLDVIKTLIARKADLSAPEREGYTPLHFACLVNRQGRIDGASGLGLQWEAVKFMLDQDGDHQHRRNQQGFTPLMIAARSRAPLDFIFQMLTYSGGTILDCCPGPHDDSENDDTTSRKRNHSMAFQH